MFSFKLDTFKEYLEFLSKKSNVFILIIITGLQGMTDLLDVMKIAIDLQEEMIVLEGQMIETEIAIRIGKMIETGTEIKTKIGIKTEIRTETEIDQGEMKKTEIDQEEMMIRTGQEGMKKIVREMTIKISLQDEMMMTKIAQEEMMIDLQEGTGLGLGHRVDQRNPPVKTLLSR